MFKFLFSTMAIILVIAGAIYLLINLPKTIDTVYTAKDYKSFLEKIGIEESNSEDKLGLIDLLKGDFIDTDLKEIDITFTDSEIAAFLNTALKPDIASNYNVKFEENTLILTFKAAENIDQILEVFPEIRPYKSYFKYVTGKSIYWKLRIIQGVNKELTAETIEIYAGQFKLPLNQIRSELTNMGTRFKSVLDSMENLRIDEFVLEENYLRFKGMIPTKIKLQ